MSKKDRRTRVLTIKQYGRLYVRYDCDLATCFYCGHPRETLDHVPPISVVADMGEAAAMKRKIRFFLVPACGTCNSLLGARRLALISERVGFLWGAYCNLVEKTYHGWTKAELADIGPGLKGYIGACARRADLYVDKLRGVEKRLLWLSRSEDDAL